MIDPAVRAHAQDLLTWIDASPSPWHAGEQLAQRLTEAGFQMLQENQTWQLEPERAYCVQRDGSSLIAFALGSDSLSQRGFQIIGAHTDSPGLRIKPRPDVNQGGYRQLGVEIYGGPILATFTDRDLTLAGRVSVRNGQRVTQQLFHHPQPLLRLPNLAIHMNRTVNEDGLKLHKQTELPLIFSVCEPDGAGFQAFLSDQLDVDSKDILSWDLAVCDTQPGAFFGPDQEFLANSQLDNLASCHAALSALLNARTRGIQGFPVVAFFDHEEVGSVSAKGADGSFLQDVLQRILDALGLSTDDSKQAFANSFQISADMAHAYHPNFPSAYEPEHRVIVNQGPVIKRNANLRYATDAASESRFIELCAQTNVAYQQYTHRSDLPCGSTIGPLSSARLGIQTVDVGNPMWAMHSLRESAGVLDHHAITQVFTHFLR